MIGLLKRLLSLLALLCVAYAGFRWGRLVFPPMERALGLGGAESEVTVAPSEPSPELADSTLDRFERFRDGDGPDRMALSGMELSSVVRFSLPGIVPPGVADPAVELTDGRVRLSARVAVAAFPRMPRLDDIIGVLPDTVTVEMTGSLVPLDQEHLALLVDHIEASGIPLPRRLIPEVLRGFGRDASRALPDDALAVPKPDGVQSVFVQRDSLVLIARR